MSIKAQAILLIPGQSTNSGAWESALALGLTLKKAKKDYFIFIENQEVLNSLLTSPEGLNFPIFDTGATKDVIVTLTDLKDQVSDVKWQQINQTVELRLSTIRGNIGDPDVTVSRTHNSFDLKIFIDVSAEEAQLLDFVDDNILSEGESIYFQPSTNGDIIPVLVYNFIKENKLKFDSDSAQKLLDALYIATNSFTKHQSAEIFSIASRLMTIINKSSKKGYSRPKTEKEEVVKKDTIASQTAPLPVEHKTESTKKSPVQNSLEQTPETKNLSTQNISEKMPITSTPIPSTQDLAVTSKQPDKVIETPKVVREIKEPEELPADYDPLAPAANLPTPLVLDNTPPPPKPQDNSPLPKAE